MKIHVAHVGADVARPCEPYERVEIGAVEIDLAAVRMCDRTNLADGLIENAVRRGIGDHRRSESRCTRFGLGAEVHEVDSLHFEWALAEHLPFGVAAGAGGYFYQQLTNDYGSGNLLGSFRGRVAAVGLLLSYTFKAGEQQVTLSGRGFHEFDVKNRVRGDSIFASLSFQL